MKIISLILLPICLTLAGGTAYADYMLVKYRSGKVQTISLDEPGSRIASISYEDGNVHSPSLSPVTDTKTVAGESADERAETHQEKSGISRQKNKPEVRLEWAPPVE